MIPAGTLEGAELFSAPPANDFVVVPWAEAHRKTALGRDIDASAWVQVRVRVRLPEPPGGFVLEMHGDVAESYYAECRDARGAGSIVRGGIGSPNDALRYREGFYPWGTLEVAADAACAFVLPRASAGRVRMVSAPQIDRARLAPKRNLMRSVSVIANLTMFGAIDASVGTCPWVSAGTGHRA